MQIQSSSVQANSFHTLSKQLSREVSVAGSKGDDSSGRQILSNMTQVSLSTSAQAMSVQGNNASSTALENEQASTNGTFAPSTVATELEEARKKVENDPVLNLIKGIVESLTGRKVETMQVGLPSDEKAEKDSDNPAAERFVSETTKTTYIEYEKTSFVSNGSVTLADGTSIQWNVSMDMERFYREDSTFTAVVDREKRDPLVINLDGGPVELQGQRMRFELNGDGKVVDIPMLSGQRGYLALDKNNNGRVDSGLELFGPQTNDGFSELAQYDEDGNGWIDAGDSVFKELRIWFPTMDGGGLLKSLEEFGLAAIQLNAMQTPFELKDTNNQSLGSIRATGVYLTQSGQAGTVQQIDVTV